MIRAQIVSRRTRTSTVCRATNCQPYLLESMLSPLERSLVLAPVDDEPLTPEEAAAIEAGIASLERGEGIPHEEVLAEFGLASSETDSSR